METESELKSEITWKYTWKYTSSVFPGSLPLEGMKRKIMRNLRTLEQEGMVNSNNDYQEVINAIAKASTVRYRCLQSEYVGYSVLVLF